MITQKEIHIEAPFAMPAIKVPDFVQCGEKLITDFGAESGNQAKTTRAIASAIADANANGGGTIIFPKGEWPTAKVHLKSNVHLHLRESATLVFSENPDDYLPPVHTSWEGLECYNYSPLIYAFECENIAITGEGELRAKMDVWEQWFPRPEPHMQSLKDLYFLAARNTPVEERQMVKEGANLRPHFLQFNRCRNILLEGISIQNSPFWTIHVYLSKDVAIKNVKVRALGHNNDGVDPEMSENVLIEDCVFDQGDDAIAIKSGRNQDAWRLNAPCKNIIMRNCTVKNGHQLVAIGTELSGGIENVFIDNCTVVDGAKLDHLLFIKTNERRGGFVHNVHLRNIAAGNINQGILGIETDVLYQWRHLVPTIERRLTPIADVFLTNIKAASVRFVSKILGQAELPVDNVHLQNVIADSVHEKEHIHENLNMFHQVK